MNPEKQFAMTVAVLVGLVLGAFMAFMALNTKTAPVANREPVPAPVVVPVAKPAICPAGCSCPCCRVKPGSTGAILK